MVSRLRSVKFVSSSNKNNFMRTIKSKESISLQGNIGERTVQLLEHTGLMWSVKKEPLFTGEGIRTESFGIIRQDNQQWLGTVGNQYECFQNWDLAETIIQAAEGLGDRFRGGLIGCGDKVFVQVALQDEHVANDTIKRYITALNSHDGSTSIGFGSSNTVVVCQNTFMRSYREISKFRHTTNSKQRIELAAQDLRAAIIKDEKLMDSYKRMSEEPINKKLFGDVVKIMFGEDLSVDKSEVSSRKANQIKDFNVTLQKELASHGETLWGLFNAVTYYENHLRVKKDDQKDKHIMIGGGYRRMNTTFDEIMAYVEEHTAELVTV